MSKGLLQERSSGLSAALAAVILGAPQPLSRSSLALIWLSLLTSCVSESHGPVVLWGDGLFQTDAGSVPAR